MNEQIYMLKVLQDRLLGFRKLNNACKPSPALCLLSWILSAFLTADWQFTSLVLLLMFPEKDLPCTCGNILYVWMFWICPSCVSLGLLPDKWKALKFLDRVRISSRPAYQLYECSLAQRYKHLTDHFLMLWRDYKVSLSPRWDFWWGQMVLMIR